jgi:hypothetical protein
VGGIEGRAILATAWDASSVFRDAIGWSPGIRFSLSTSALDQARIDRERLASNQAGRNAHRHYIFKDPA